MKDGSIHGEIILIYVIDAVGDAFYSKGGVMHGNLEGEGINALGSKA